MTDAVAHYAYIVRISTNEHDIVNNFGYRREEALHEEIRKLVMTALAGYPHLISLEFSPIALRELTDQVNEDEFYDDDEDDE